jgi:inhibitor of cysteine peptidase
MPKITFIISILMTLLTPGCTPAEQQSVTLTQEQNGKSGTFLNGATVAVRLPSNGTTGYTWEVDQLPPMLRLVEEDYEAPTTTPAVAGEGGVQTLTFRTTNAGAGRLRLVYRQPWDKTAAPVETFTYSLRVDR